MKFPQYGVGYLTYRPACMWIMSWHHWKECILLRQNKTYLCILWWPHFIFITSSVVDSRKEKVIQGNDSHILALLYSWEAWDFLSRWVDPVQHCIPTRQVNGKGKTIAQLPAFCLNQSPNQFFSPLVSTIKNTTFVSSF